MTDPNFRIFTDRTTITVFNHEIFVRGTDLQEIFSRSSGWKRRPTRSISDGSS